MSENVILEILSAFIHNREPYLNCDVQEGKVFYAFYFQNMLPVLAYMDKKWDIMKDENIKKKLGFGVMRLPKVEEQVDIPAVCEMVDAFMEAGFNYFDTARAYTDSEEKLGNALADVRAHIVISTKTCL